MAILDPDIPPATHPTSSDEGETDEEEEPDYDWDEVVHQQPDQVVAWIEYLHETEQRDVFANFMQALGVRNSRHPPSSAFRVPTSVHSFVYTAFSFMYINPVGTCLYSSFDLVSYRSARITQSSFSSAFSSL